MITAPPTHEKSMYKGKSGSDSEILAKYKVPSVLPQI